MWSWSAFIHFRPVQLTPHGSPARDYVWGPRHTSPKYSSLTCLTEDAMPKEDTRINETLRAIYSETTVDHIIHPRNAESLPNPDGFAACQSGCGESMKIWLRVRNGRVAAAGFWTDGCAATVACGSMATDLVRGKPVSLGLTLTAQCIADALVDLPEGNFHCAELAAHTLSLALRDCLSTAQQPWKRLYRR